MGTSVKNQVPDFKNLSLDQKKILGLDPNSPANKALSEKENQHVANIEHAEAKYREGVKSKQKYGDDTAIIFGEYNKGGTVDSIPSLLTPGEFVVNKASAKAYGYNNLRNINKYARGGRVQKFKEGGELKGGGTTAGPLFGGGEFEGLMASARAREKLLDTSADKVAKSAGQATNMIDGMSQAGKKQMAIIDEENRKRASHVNMIAGMSASGQKQAEASAATEAELQGLLREIPLFGSSTCQIKAKQS